MNLKDWYGPDAVIHRAVILREMDGTDVGLRDAPVVRYAKGTTVQAFIDDPERPGMADVQLPNGKMVRVWQDEIALDDPDDPILGLS